MKNKENKKHHESTIGKIIYGFMLFAPLFAIGVTCLYGIFNKNAKDSYYAENINQVELININNVEDLEPGNKYKLNISNGQNDNVSLSFRYDIYFKDFNVINSNNFASDYFDDLLGLSFRKYSGYGEVFIHAIKNPTVATNTSSTVASLDIEFTLENISTLNLNNLSFINFYSFKYNPSSYLSEVFYYSIYQVEESNLFNWAKTSIIYDGIKATTESLSITNTFIPMLLTYWLIISVLYFLYDIILMILNILHRKIHELQDSF